MTDDTSLAPIILFAYKRPAELQQTLAHLKVNYLASASELYVFVDGPKKEADLPKVKAVRSLVDQITGFRAVHRHYADRNQGLANSIIAGVSQVITLHGQAIILEDDILTACTFLNFMNQCLTEYKSEKKVFSISGYSFPFKKPNNYNYDAYFIQRPNSWGWATWADRWEMVDWSISDYNLFIKNNKEKQNFREGGADLLKMLEKQQNNIIDSWYIRWCYNQCKLKSITIYPVKSKVQNIGFNKEATNTNVYNRYYTHMDCEKKHAFILPKQSVTNNYYHKLNLHKYSLKVRIYNRIITHIARLLKYD